MSPYLAVIDARVRVLLQYRAAAFAGVVTQVFFGTLRLLVFAAFYRAGAAASAAPMSFSELAAYVWLGQALWPLLPWNADDEIVQQVRSGGVAFDLLRPLDLYAFWFARTLAFRVGRTTTRAVPIAVLAALVLPLCGLSSWGLPAPPSAASAALFALSLAAMVLLSTAITMLLQVSLLHSLTGIGVQATLPALVMLLSGMVVPLPVFPSFLQPFLHAQPLRGLCDVPNRIYTGHIAPSDAVAEIALQLGWVGVLVWLGRAGIAAATRRIVIQGG